MTKRDSKLPVSPNGKWTYVKGVKFKHLLLRVVTENCKLQWPNGLPIIKYAILIKNCLVYFEWITISVENQQSTGNNHNLGKNLSNQFGSTLSLTHLAKEQWDKSISPKGTKVEQKCSKSNVKCNLNWLNWIETKLNEVK